jgi:transcriptional regulator with XRE-family HTH domain
MVIGERLKALREARNLSQGDIERRTGILRSYISRIENGYAHPEIETLERLARALEVPMYQLFHEGEVAASVKNLKLQPEVDQEWGSKSSDAAYLTKLRRLLGKMKEDDRKFVLYMAQKRAKR